jgi:hypothetical protein
LSSTRVQHADLGSRNIILCENGKGWAPSFLDFAEARLACCSTVASGAVSELLHSLNMRQLPWSWLSEAAEENHFKVNPLNWFPEYSDSDEESA